MGKIAVILSGTGEKLRNLLAQFDLQTRREVARLLVNILACVENRSLDIRCDSTTELLFRYGNERPSTKAKYEIALAEIEALVLGLYVKRPVLLDEAKMLLEEAITESESPDDVTLQAFLFKRLGGTVQQRFPRQMRNERVVCYPAEEAVSGAIDSVEAFVVVSPKVVMLSPDDLDQLLSEYADLRKWPVPTKGPLGYDFNTDTGLSFCALTITPLGEIIETFRDRLYVTVTVIKEIVPPPKEN